MMKRLAYLMMMPCGLALATAPAPAHPDEPVPKREKKVPDPNKRVCRFAADTGSHIPQSTCQPQAQWDATDRANAAAADEALRRRPAAQQ